MRHKGASLIDSATWRTGVSEKLERDCGELDVETVRLARAWQLWFFGNVDCGSRLSMYMDDERKLDSATWWHLSVLSCSFGNGVLVRVDAWLTQLTSPGHRWRKVRSRPRRDQLAGPHTTCRHLIIVCISATYL